MEKYASPDVSELQLSIRIGSNDEYGNYCSASSWEIGFYY